MKTRTKRKKVAKRKPAILELRLYVANTTARSALARENLRRLCEQHLQEPYSVTVIDLVQQPELARRDEIMAIPTLVRLFPGPRKSVIGSLADSDRVMRALELGDQPESFASLLSRSVPQIGNA